MKFLDLFAGIGGFRLGMEMAGHECVGYVEIDKFARQSYQAIHGTEGEWTANDITRVSDDDIRELRDRSGRVDVICGGFPCQAFSVAGKRGGFDDTRGTLFFEIMRFASILRPRYLFLENVEGLLSHDGGNTFETIIRTLDEIGYWYEWDSLNSKDFGVPQNRKRVFIIGHLRGGTGRKVFPISQDGELDSQARRKEREKTQTIPCLEATQHKGISSERFYALAVPVLTPDREHKRQNGRRMKEHNEPMFTSTNQDRHGIYDGYRIRRLTPKETWRLQGFPDWTFDRARAAGVSDSQLYRQSGNSVTVNVIYEIAKRLGSESI